MPLNTSIAASTPISTLKRRIAGERNWRMEIEEILGSERLGMQTLRAIRNRHPHDAVTQGLVAEALENVAERVIKLGELYHYKTEGDTNGQHEASSGGA